MNTTAFINAYVKAVEAIRGLKLEARELKKALDTIIDACDEIEDTI